MFGSPITRKIWTDVDNLILVYVGSAAEFPLLEVNEWLFFTGRLPEAPIRRFIETLMFNRRIFEVPLDEVPALAKSIRQIHSRVEQDRQTEEGGAPVIPNRGFLQVGAMLIEYGILGREYLDCGKPMSDEEKEAYYQDQKSFFKWMDIKDLPDTYPVFLHWREDSLKYDLTVHRYTAKLFAAYRKDLGAFRTWLLKQFMAHFVPEPVREKAKLRKNIFFGFAYFLYPRIRGLGVSRLAHRLLLDSNVRKTLST